jgi:hypothetical protein
MSKKPDYDVYVVEKLPEGETDTKPFWTRIGAGWNHSDNKGVNVVLQALPVGANIVLRKHKPKDE